MLDKFLLGLVSGCFSLYILLFFPPLVKNPQCHNCLLKWDFCIWWPFWDCERMGEEATNGVLKTGKHLPYQLQRYTDILELRPWKIHEVKECWNAVEPICMTSRLESPSSTSTGHPAGTPRLVLQELSQQTAWSASGNPAQSAGLLQLSGKCQFIFEKKGFFGDFDPVPLPSPCKGPCLDFRLCMYTAYMCCSKYFYFYRLNMHLITTLCQSKIPKGLGNISCCRQCWLHGILGMPWQFREMKHLSFA